MSETVLTIAAPVEQTGRLAGLIDQIPGVFRKGVAVGSILVAAACGNTDAAPAPPNNSVQVSADQLAKTRAACGVSLDLNAKSANTEATGVAFFPPMYTTDSTGNKQPYSLDKSVPIIKKTLATDPNALAVFDGLITRSQDNLSAPDQTTFPAVKASLVEILNNPDAAAKKSEAACNIANFARITTNFATTANKSQGTDAVRDNNAVINGIVPNLLTNDGTLTGYTFGYNKSAGMESSKAARLEEVSSETIITISESRTVTKQTIGSGTIELDKNGSPVKPTASATATINAAPSVSNPGDVSVGGITAGPTAEKKPSGPDAAPQPGVVKEATPGPDKTPDTGGVITTQAGGSPGNIVKTTPAQSAPVEVAPAPAPPVYTTTEAAPVTASSIPQPAPVTEIPTSQPPSSQAKPSPTPLPIGCNPYVPSPNCK